MAVIEIFNGTLAAHQKGDWIAVPASAIYTIQVNTDSYAPLGFELSIDGVNPVQFNQAPNAITNAGYPVVYRLSNIPIAWVRASNGFESNDSTGSIYVQSV